jgi:signal transduction histidine kinase/ABC-type uncharacterized transport system substrate-binding protein
MVPATLALDSAMRKALTEPGRHPVDLFSESLDALRFPEAQIEGESVALLAKKYATMHIDAVVAVGSAALDFAEKHRSQLWPDARILFQIVPVEKLSNGPFSATTTGIPVEYDFAGTVELAIALRPGTRHLVVIYGSADFDRAAADIARKQLERFSQRLNTEYWTDASIDQFLQRIRQLDANDAVLYISIVRDADGHKFGPIGVAERLAAVSPAPIYSTFERFIGHGIVAGSVYNYEARGKRMAELVQEALSAPTASIPPVTMASSCMADANQLKRFGMAEGSLPPGCDIRFREFSVWRDYRWYIVGALIAIALQSLLILGFLIQWRRRRTAEAEASRRRAELAHASRLALAGELTASISHEINQPLGAILANTAAANQLLSRTPPDIEEFKRIVADIRRQDLRASEIISRVRALLSGRKIERQSSDINAIVVETVELLAHEAARRGVRLEMELSPSIGSLEVDRIQLQQVLINLCVNGMDAMVDTAAERRVVRIRTTERAGDEIEIAVLDSGHGIATDNLSRLFDSFFTTKSQGMGLGLAIARSIVEAHDGYIVAEPRPQGGTVLRVVLPRAREATSPSAAVANVMINGMPA